jgi:hypothetical protein
MMIENVVIPEPNPDNFWALIVGQSRQITRSFEITAIKIDEASAELRCSGRGTGSKGRLRLNEPAVLLRDVLGTVIVTATLRKIEAGVAYLQITAPINMPQGRNPSSAQKPQ